MEKFFLFIIGASLSFGVGYMGSKRKIGFGWAFFLSLCNLFLGLIVTLCSKKLAEENQQGSAIRRAQRPSSLEDYAEPEQKLAEESMQEKNKEL